MKPLYKGIIVAVLHIALVGSLGAKLLYDRATRPRVWARTANYDPDLPIRGRYVSLRLQVTPEGFDAKEWQDNSGNKYWYRKSVKLGVKDNTLIVTPSDEDQETNVDVAPRVQSVAGHTVVTSPEMFIEEPVAFFIPEHAPNPARLNRGEELWVEVTVPKQGPPRPIRLGIKKDGVLTPLNLD